MQVLGVVSKFINHGQNEIIYHFLYLSDNLFGFIDIFFERYARQDNAEKIILVQTLLIFEIRYCK
jgi:hypothetical protein